MPFETHSKGREGFARPLCGSQPHVCSSTYLCGQALSPAGSSGAAAAQHGAASCWGRCLHRAVQLLELLQPQQRPSTAGCCHTPVIPQPRATHWTETRHQTSEPEDKRGKKKADTGQVRVFFVTLLYVTSHNCCHRNIMQGTLMVWLYGVLHVPKSYLKYLVKHNLSPPLVLHRAGSYW